MPRVAGQIDVAKNEAILDAAVEVLSERGLAAPLAAIARRAGVSKQTIYNHYGSKADLLRALVQRRQEHVAAMLQLPGASDQPQAALAAFARSMLEGLLDPRRSALLRVIIQGAVELPDLAVVIYEAGPLAYHALLADFLRREARIGRMAVDDPGQAAEFFIGMVGGSHQTALLLGVDRGLGVADVDRIACEAAARFMRAYAA